MLCKECRFRTAVTKDDLCEYCAPGAPAAAAVPAAPVLPVAPPAPSPAPAFALRSPVGLGHAVTVLLCCVAAVDLFALWADVLQWDVMNDLARADLPGGLERRAERADSLYGTAGLLQGALMVATGVVFLVWFHRVRANADVFEPHVHRWSRGWSVGSWFVPVMNLWVPRRAMADVWEASDSSGRTDPSLALVNAWWAMWVSGFAVSWWSSRLYLRAEEAAEIKSAVTGVMFADVLDLTAAALALLVVRRVTAMQDQKARLGIGAWGRLPAPGGRHP